MGPMALGPTQIWLPLPYPPPGGGEKGQHARKWDEIQQWPLTVTGRSSQTLVERAWRRYAGTARAPARKKCAGVSSPARKGARDGVAT